MSKHTAPSREWQAQMAWEAYRSMLLTEIRFPFLKDNPTWQVLRGEAFAQYEHAFVMAWTK